MPLWAVTASGSGAAMQRTDQKVANRPEERWERITALLQSSPALGLAGRTVVVDAGLQLPAPLAAALAAALAQVHHPDLVDFLRGAHADWASKDCDADFADEAGYLVPYHFSNRLAYSRCPEAAAYHNAGSFCTDRTTPIGPQTYPMALLSAACAYRAVEVLLQEKCNAVYACTLHPGHHSGKCNYGGYCYLNNAAVAVVTLRRTFGRVAVIDVDYHHGNGTQEIFYDRDDVFTASLHMTPDVDYPFYSGRASEEGCGAGAGCNLNVPLPPGTAAAAYLAALRRVIAAVQAFGAEALVVAFGGDTLRGDPDANPRGGLALEVADYEAMGGALAALGLPTVITQEGGYEMGAIAAVVESFLKPFAGP